MNLPFRFEFIPYPLWRRKSMPAQVGALLAGEADRHPPATPIEMAHYLTRWRLLPPGMDAVAARAALKTLTPTIETVALDAKPAAGTQPVRLPAQWQPMEAVIVSFPVLYPPLWKTHIALIEAISSVARVDVLIPSPLWAGAIWLWLTERGQAKLDNVRLLDLPTDDIWVRDYGPLIGLDRQGQRVAVSAIYDPLDTYPQTRDNAMPERWAAHRAMPCCPLDLHMEGGNVWSDGAGTLLMSDDLFARHPQFSREDVVKRLHQAFVFDRLITVPPLAYEETRHVDLLVKLADAHTVLISAPTPPINRARLREAAAILSRETNAQGQRYRVIELPTPAPYLNWFVYPIWRSYTNALTVNGQVLVPTFGVPSDAQALAIYRDAMPDHAIIPIDCSASANGGGAVHCLTKEVPSPLP